MTRVGFVLCLDSSWQGGLNYYKNLFHAVYNLPDRQLEIIVFTGYKNHLVLTEGLPNVGFILSSAFDRFSFLWWIRKVFQKTFHKDPILGYLFSKHKINILSHSSEAASFKKIPVISWIADFQHLFLPEFFSPNEIKARNKLFEFLVNHSKLVILSSYSAREDFRKFSPININKVRVLQFCVNPNLRDESNLSEEELKSRYKINGEFFFLPNQFWAHKNHKVVINALASAIRINKNIQIVCTGNTNDYRQPEHFKNIQSEVSSLGLDSHFRILGIVPYTDLIALMKYSIATINPSLFEGWSTTVEEAKCLNKRLLLSKIGVHIEQNPPRALYFNPHDSKALAECLANLLASRAIDDNEKSRLDYGEKFTAFGYAYQNIIQEALNG